MYRSKSFVTRTSNFKPALAVVAGAALFSALSQSALAAEPVVAKNVYVQLLAKPSLSGNTLVTAVYNSKEWELQKLRKPTTMKFALDDTSVVLHDDGLDGDAVRGDGVFSGIALLNTDAIVKQYDTLISRERQTGRATVINHFDGRRLLRKEKIDVSTLAKNFLAGIVVPLLPLPGITVVDADASLVIRDQDVVEDPDRTFDKCTGLGNPDGVWTFKHLMTEMANTPKTGVSVEDFTRMWLAHWESDQSINGFLVPHRQPRIRNLIIDPWETASGGAGMPLDMDKAPFKLLAIVNRIDLRSNSLYGGGNAGEGRFVFAVQGPNCNQEQFTVIFEYGIEKKGCFATKAWGQQWADLSSMTVGSAAYNAALENITESFVAADAAPLKPNGSALNQLRTNEIAMAMPFPNNNWELREFVISNSGWNNHFLTQDTVKLTPDLSLNGTPTLAAFINNPVTPFPLRYPTIADPFTGGRADEPFMFWDAPGIANNNKRHDFSLNTCNGCHTRETNTGFTHIHPGSIPAGLSGFMTGINVIDPHDLVTVRHFDEFTRRKDDLEALVNNSCLIQLPKLPLFAVH